MPTPLAHDQCREMKAGHRDRAAGGEGPLEMGGNPRQLREGKASQPARHERWG